MSRPPSIRSRDHLLNWKLLLHAYMFVGNLEWLHRLLLLLLLLDRHGHAVLFVHVHLRELRSAATHVLHARSAGRDDVRGRVRVLLFGVSLSILQLFRHAHPVHVDHRAQSPVGQRPQLVRVRCNGHLSWDSDPHHADWMVQSSVRYGKGAREIRHANLGLWNAVVADRRSTEMVHQEISSKFSRENCLVEKVERETLWSESSNICMTLFFF